MCQGGRQCWPGPFILDLVTELPSLPRTVLWSHLLRESPFTVGIISNFHGSQPPTLPTPTLASVGQ